MTGSERQDLEIVLTRDSVCMADDIDAQHEVRFALPLDATVGSLCTAILARGYLARVSGGEASWSVTAGRDKIAVLAQQWRGPAFVQPQETPLSLLCSSDQTCNVHVEYHTQKDPMDVARSLSSPDRRPI